MATLNIFSAQSGIWDVNAATQYLSVQGWILSDAQNKIAIIQDKALQKYRVEATTLAVDAYVKGDLDFGSLQSLVGSSGLTQVEQSSTSGERKP